MSVRYLVEIDLETKGDLGISRLSTGVSRLDGAVSRLSMSSQGSVSRLIGGMDSVVSRAVDVGMSLAKWGTIAGVGLLTYGVASLNSELEKTQISLAAIFTANGRAKDLDAGMGLAADTITRMRKDAQALPGEFEDLLNIMQTTAVGAFRSGMGVDELREMSAKLMATGVAVKMDLGQVAREAAQLFEGRSGSHNVLGMRLMGLAGDSAKAFNAMSPEDRMKKMNVELDKYAPAIAKFEKTFDAVSSTFKDNTKELIRLGTEPLFENVKGLLGGANEWMSEHGALMRSWATTVGQDLSNGLTTGLAFAREYGPAFAEFGSNLYKGAVDVWVDAKPYVQQFGAALKEALKDPGTVDKLITLAKIYAAIKGVQLVGGVVGGAVGISKEVAGWAGGAAGGIAGAARGGLQLAGGIGNALISSGAVAEVQLMAVALGGSLSVAGAAAVVVGAGLAALGGVVAAGYQGFRLYNDVQRNVTANARAQLDAVDRIINSGNSMSEHFDSYTAAAGAYAAAHNDVMVSALGAASGLSGLGAALSTYGIRSSEAAKDAGRYGDMLTGMITSNTLDLTRRGGDAQDKKPKVSGGHGGTNIQKVEIVVTSNSEPSRVAHLVFNQIAQFQRRPGRSPDVTDYSR